MALRWESKRPAEVRTYQIDWSDFLGSDTIATRTIVAVGVTVDNGGGQGVIDAGNKGITLKLSGGTSGTLARITNTIVTAAGETEVEKIVLWISDFAEPVSLELAKAQCRVLDDSEDALLCSYVRAAREWVENYTGHILVRRPVTQTFSEFWDRLELYHRPVSEVIKIDYTDADGAAQDILPVDLLVTAGIYPYRIRPVDAWPTILTYSPITVTYVAGYDEGECPQALIQAMLMLIAHYHTNRAAARAGAGVVSQEAPLAVTSLCDQFRVPVV
jgi:uncharacterized phiE125 gp8 family phage protein